MNISKHFFIYSIKANLHVNFVRKRRHYFWLFQRIKVIFLIPNRVLNYKNVLNQYDEPHLVFNANFNLKQWTAKAVICKNKYSPFIGNSWHISITVCIIKRLPKIGDVFGASKKINKDICKTVKWRVVDGWNRTLALDAITFGVGVPF